MSTTFEDALVLGILDANIAMATGYPGFPITPIFEKVIERSFQASPRLFASWCINETVALGNAIGACLSGARSVVLVKNHGLNTIQDMIINLSYLGTRAGMLIISADDIGVKASHNESDSRLYGPLNMVPVIEPATVEDAYRYVSYGLELSEENKTPVILRISGSQLLQVEELNVRLQKSYTLPVYNFKQKEGMCYIGPDYYREMKISMIERVVKIKALKSNKFNAFILGNCDVGIICSGNSYNKVLKAFPNAKILKLGLVYPIILDDLEQFFSHINDLKKVWIIEETENLIEYQITEFLYKKASRHYDSHSLKEVIGKGTFSKVGEISEKEILLTIGGKNDRETSECLIAHKDAQPVKLCPACPARSTLLSLKLLGITVIGDAGCTALGTLEPFKSVHCCVCMGSSIPIAAGINRIAKNKVVALIGDSAFFHSGILGLLDEIDHSTTLFTIIFNNKNAGMTGGQIVYDGIQNYANSSGKIKKILQAAGVMKENIKVIQESLNLAKIKSEICKMYHEKKGNRVLIIEGHCLYNFRDISNIDLRHGNAVKILKGSMLDPGCFAYQKVDANTHKLYIEHCGNCRICEKLVSK